MTADLDLKWVRATTASVTLGPVGLGWVASPPDGESFVAPIGTTPERIATFDPSMNQTAIRRVGEEMLAKRITFALMPAGVTARPAYLAVRNLETLNWRLMLVIPQSELLAEARVLLNRQLWLGAIGLLLLIAAITAVASGIAHPIHELAESVGRAAHDDDMNFQLPDARRRDEVGVLTEALRRMRNALQETHSPAGRKPGGTSAARARARNRSEHPAVDAAETRYGRPSTSAEVAAALMPAKQVGGDLYDYFPIRDGHLLFAIGDVSDKGIPAALFMARLSALLRVLGAASELPDRLLAGINARLVEGNDACMFVTIGCGLLHLESGRIRYASAGHEPPLLRSLEGAVQPLATENGVAIGIEASAEYLLSEGFMAPGDTLVLFTDGVTEAEAEDRSLWGIERLTTLLREAPDGNPDALVKRIVDAVSAHASGYHATDDLTVLAVRFNPPSVVTRQDATGVHWLIDVDASPAGIRQAQQRLHGILAARHVSQERIGDVELIAEELLTNIIRAADIEGRPTQVTMDCALTPAAIALTVRDDGREFNPLAVESPDLDADIVDRDVGGLGIHIVRQLADDCSYARADSWNVFEVRLARTPDRY